MKKAMLLWQAITPLSLGIGVGQDNASMFDPLAPEGGPAFPMVPACSIKGMLRGGEGLREDSDLRPTFTFTGSHLLAVPVASSTGTSALVTGPIVLERLNRDRDCLGFPALTLPAEPEQSEDLEAVVATSTKLDHRGGVRLNNLDFVARRDDAVDELCAELVGADEESAQQLARRLCLVGDDVFSSLCATALVTPHTRLDPYTGHVEQDALWYETSVPAESLLTSFVMSSADDLSVLQAQRWRPVGRKGRGQLTLSSVVEV